MEATRDLVETIDAVLAEKQRKRLRRKLWAGARSSFQKVIKAERLKQFRKKFDDVMKARITAFRKWRAKRLRMRLWRGAGYRHYSYAMRALRARLRKVFLGRGLFD